MPNSGIVAARVPLTDPDTGLISREWYNFLYSLYVLAGSGRNVVSITDLQVGPPTDEQVMALFGEVTKAIQTLRVTPPAVPGMDALTTIKAIQALRVTPPTIDVSPIVKAFQGTQVGPSNNVLLARIAELTKAVQALQTAPTVVFRNLTNADIPLALIRTALTTPVTVTAQEASQGVTIYVKLTVPGAIAVNLPAGVTGYRVTVKDGTGDAGANNITTTPAAGNIDGAANNVIVANYGSRDYLYTGIEWSNV